jgi:glyceraldehyde-3-phosphate dehydrogenase/erythrose-4-phosphate dehydrogenase
VGIAGFGNIGRIHYEALEHCALAKVVGIAAPHTPTEGEAPAGVQWHTD